MKEAVASGIALSEDVIDALFEKFIAGMPRFLQKNSPVTPFCPCVDKALPVVKVLRNLSFIYTESCGQEEVRHILFSENRCSLDYYV